VKLDLFPDNDEVAYRVTLETIKDITTPPTRWERVTKRQVREMFQKFIQTSPELWQSSRIEQIDEFNSQRRQLRRPVVAPGILMSLEISYTEGP
jgi:hypothetical protein